MGLLTQQRVPNSPVPAGAQADVQDVVILAHEADLGMQKEVKSPLKHYFLSYK